MIFKYWIIYCDGDCLEVDDSSVYSVRGFNITKHKRALKKMGWTFPNRETAYCPKCSEKVKQELSESQASLVNNKSGI